MIPSTTTANCQLPKLPTANCQLPTANCSSPLQNPVHDFRVLPHFIFGSWKHAYKHAIIRLDAAECRAECLFDSALSDSPSGKNFECEAWFRGLAHHAVHPRRIALHVNLVLHFHDLAVERLLPFLARPCAVIDASGIEVHVPSFFFHL